MSHPLKSVILVLIVFRKWNYLWLGHRKLECMFPPGEGVGDCQQIC